MASKPSLSAITATFFVSLINRLAVRPPPPDAFLLSNVVQPVTIVDSDVALAAVTTSQLLDTPFTAGPLVAPAINSILADSQQQPAGNYLVQVFIEAIDTVNTPIIQLARRNGANTADIWSQDFYGTSSANGPLGIAKYLQLRVTLQVNERLVVRNSIGGGAASRFQASIWLLPS